MLARLTLLLTLLPISGCSTLAYYGQAISGHMDIVNRREPVAEILADPARDPALKAQLAQARAFRDFASDSLALPDNDSYRSYVQLDRPHVVWNVYAAEEFSLEPKTWCFPVVGCVAYRGYFAQADAQALADALAAEGMDVFVGGATAYSTLGWFDDPIVSPMLERGELGLAGLIFHELAHQRLYVKGDTAFNEGFATTVEEGGVRRWLQGAEPSRLPGYEDFLARRRDFLALVVQTRARLAALYADETLDLEARREAKQAIIEAMRAGHAALKAGPWRGFAGYDAWFAQPINNARLAAVAVYREQVPDFERWLGACAGDFARFYRAMEGLAELDRSARRARLAGPAACSG